MTEIFELIWVIVVNMHLWLIISAIVTVMALRDGLIQIAVGFAGLFLFVLMQGWDKIIGEYIMVHLMIAIGLGLIIAFFIWQARD